MIINLAQTGVKVGSGITATGTQWEEYGNSPQGAI